MYKYHTIMFEMHTPCMSIKPHELQSSRLEGKANAAASSSIVESFICDPDFCSCFWDMNFTNDVHN